MKSISSHLIYIFTIILLLFPKFSYGQTSLQKKFEAVDNEIVNKEAAINGTVVSGAITTDTIWAKANSPYIVVGNISISGVTLTIEPGVIVKFDGYYSIYGSINAQGRADDRITFTSNMATPVKGDWDRVSLSNASVIKYTIAEYANIGFYGFSVAPTISHSIIRNNNTGVYFLRGSRPNVTYNDIVNNTDGITLDGYFVAAFPLGSYNFNNFIGNSQYNVRFTLNNESSGNIVDFENNWWGITDPLEIENKILHSQDQFPSPTAGYEPFLTSPRGEIDPDLVGHWQFDETSSAVAIDASENDNDGTLINGPKWVSGRSKSALSLDGVDDFVNAGNNASLDFGTNDFAVAFWVKATGGEYRNIIRKGYGSNNPRFRLALRKIGRIRAEVTDGTNFVISSNDGKKINDNQWHHVVINFQRGGLMTRYIDGQSDGTADDISSVGNINTAASLIMAMESNTLPLTLDDVRLYRRVLLANEIKRLYTNTGLVAYWKLDELSVRAALDSSGNGHNGLLVNGPSWGDGKFNRGLVFDGMDDYMDVGHSGGLNFGTGDFSIAFWIKASYGGFHNIVRKGYGSGKSHFAVALRTNGILQTELDDGTQIVVSNDDGTVIDDDRWHHVVVNFDRDGLMTRYIDGKPDGSAVNIAGIGNINSPANLFISGQSDYSNGTLDDIRLYNRVLTISEVQDIYQLPTVTINFGDTINATLSTVTEIEEYSFTAVSGDKLVVPFGRGTSGEYYFFPYFERKFKLSSEISDFLQKKSRKKPEFT